MSNSLQLPLIEAVSRIGLADGHRFLVEEGGSRVFSDELSALKRYYKLFWKEHPLFQRNVIIYLIIRFNNGKT